MNLRVADLIDDSIVDGPGVRFCIFVQGCLHNCKDCHNPDTHSISGGFLIDIDNLFVRIKDNPLLQGVTYSGGEPFLQAYALSFLSDRIKTLNLNIIVYTGYLWEELLHNDMFFNLVKRVDIIIDGKFETNKKDISLMFRGSSNQRIIDVQKSLKSHKLCELHWQ
jgi:anaerobic ribonucleoside-triphosphate reductase activating protein